MEYTDYQLPLTDIEIANALKLINNMERGRLTVNVPKNITGSVDRVINFQKTHTAPKVFLQLRAVGVNNPIQSLAVVEHTTSKTSAKISLIPSYRTDKGAPGNLHSGTYYVDYLVIG